MNNTFIKFNNITKKFPRVVANDDVSFDIKKSSVHALLGENGAGKSTLVKVLYGLLAADHGTITFNDQELNISSPSEARNKGIGMVFQHFSLFESLTVRDNLILGIDKKISYSDLKDQLENISSKYNLPLDLDAPITSLSAGEKQRVEIVRILLQDPQLLIMDEPTGYMDAESVRLTWDLIKELKGDKSIIYVSNSIQEIEQSHDRILVFHEGRIIMDGHLDKLLESTLDYHQFQIEFEDLTDDLYNRLKNITTIVSPNRLDNTFHFYGRTRTVFFDVIKTASNEIMIDLDVKKLGLKDLLDSEFSGRGLE